jgi:DcmR-like sensory protein
MSTSTDLLAHPATGNHLVQFYGDEQVLARNVALYLKEGAEQGDWMIVIASRAHAKLFTKLLGDSTVSSEDLVRQGRLVLLDAEATLARFMVGGEPVWAKFDAVVGSLIRETTARAGSSRIRAYGEMVDLLWKAGDLGAATRLEEFWNRLLGTGRFSLFCAYTVDLLESSVQDETLLGMLKTHSHLLPVRSNGELEHAVEKALNQVLGPQAARALGPLIRATVYPRVVVPGAEATVLWLRQNLPSHADEVLVRARAYYEQECALSDSERGEPA